MNVRAPGLTSPPRGQATMPKPKIASHVPYKSSSMKKTEQQSEESKAPNRPFNRPAISHTVPYKSAGAMKSSLQKQESKESSSSSSSSSGSSSSSSGRMRLLKGAY